MAMTSPAIAAPGRRARSVHALEWSDFIALDEGDRRELVDGSLLEAEVPTKWHERLVALLSFFLTGWARTHGRVVLASGFRLRIRRDRGAMPDLQVMSRETYRTADPNGLSKGAPELVVEIVSPGSRSHDRVRKLGWYASIGVGEYWIVDPLERSLERLVLRGGHYRIEEAGQEGDVLRPSSMPGLEIPLDELWSAVTDGNDAEPAARAPVRRGARTSRAPSKKQKR